MIYGIFNSTMTQTLPSGLIAGNKSVDASFMAKIFSAMFTDGVFEGFVDGTSGNAFKTTVAPNNSMTLITAPGSCHIGGYFGFETVSEQYTPSSTARNRSLCRVIRLDMATGVISSMWEECVYNSRPLTSLSGQTFPRNTATVKELLTARVDIPAGATVITQDMITDLRVAVTK